MSVLTLPTCPTDCSGLEPVSFDTCSPVRHYGEIAKLYIARSDADDFTNPDIITEWTARLSDTATDQNSIRTLLGMGELPEPEQTEIPVAGGDFIYSPLTYNLTFNVDDTNDTNYEFYLATYCNSKKKMWIEMADGMLYGGKTGIEVTLKGTQPLLPGREELLKIILKAKWKQSAGLLRCISPMY